MKRLWIVLGIFTLLGAVALLSSQESRSYLADVVTSGPLAAVVGDVAADDETGGESLRESGMSSSSNGAFQSFDEFKTWVGVQAQQIEKSSIDPQQLEDELTRQALRLSSEERDYLQAVILDKASPANHKILSVYVLSLDAQGSRAQLGQVVTAPLVYKDFASHSPEETLSMQEKTLRRLAIDSLVEQAKVNPSEKASLENLLRQVEDPALRKYIEKKILEIP